MTHITGARGTARRPGHLFSHEEAPRGPIFAERRRGCASWFIESNFSRPLEVWRVRAVPWVTDYYLVTRLAGAVLARTARLMRRDANYEILSEDFNCFPRWRNRGLIASCSMNNIAYFRLYHAFVNRVAKLPNFKIAKFTSKLGSNKHIVSDGRQSSS